MTIEQASATLLPAARSRLHQQFSALTEPELRSRPGAKWQVVRPDVVPAWVADMDFPVAEPIRDSLHDLISSGDFGYPDWPTGARTVREAFVDRMADRYGWFVNPGDVREFTNVAQAVRVVLEAATRPGDGIAIHTPAFGPLTKMITSLGRRVVPIPMEDTEEGWRFDAGQLDSALAGAKLLLLVSPHNPTGRVFTRGELTALAAAVERNDMLVVSDELHADLTFAPHRHIPFASLSTEMGARTITVYGASKAFNLAGLRCAVAHLGPKWMHAVIDVQAGLLGSVNIFGAAATVAAWTQGDEWLDATVSYLDRSRYMVAETMRTELPMVRYHLPEATYLAWLDFRAFGWSDPTSVVRENAGIELSPGESFGRGGQGFARLNFATSWPLLCDLKGRVARSVPLLSSVA
ncbi:MalY/PatB family protein [Amycolatopsis solani]|uniref:MalY/PatB family protein n=1 Tax=Amycolatopsis solani TaxID=3028615 RepID=UPI0025B01B2C|nr:aminotransferase class I/II-fold pyridoxal phosphate-dependent enzyme [Amycolatopsis sp. MEP2-6]